MTPAPLTAAPRLELYAVPAEARTILSRGAGATASRRVGISIDKLMNLLNPSSSSGICVRRFAYRRFIDLKLLVRAFE